MIIDIIPCVAVTSLETDAFMAFVACIDMLMVGRNLSARSKKERTHGAVCYSEEKKVQGCVSQRLRSNEFSSTESWRIGIERCGGTH